MGNSGGYYRDRQRGLSGQTFDAPATRLTFHLRAFASVKSLRGVFSSLVNGFGWRIEDQDSGERSAKFLGAEPKRTNT